MLRDAAQARARSLPLRSWALGDAADQFVQIEMTNVSGPQSDSDGLTTLGGVRSQ